MKLMGNPWIVGALCVVAVGVVGYQFLPPRSSVGSATASNGSALVPAAAPASPPPAAAASDPARATARTTPGTNAPSSATLIEVSYVQSHFTQWVESPARDPFLFSPPIPPEAAVAVVSPVSHWKLKAIWRQTGNRLAAINQGIFAEGDVIEGYRIEQIDSDQVWFAGPTGRESLGFTKPQPPPGTPAKANGTIH